LFINFDMSSFHVSISMLRVLDALAKHSSFTRAANELCVTQSGVSHSIRALEEMVGVQLVVRSRDGVTFTEAGRSALGEVRKALAAIDRMRDISHSTHASGPVRIGMVPSVAGTLAPKALKDLRKEQPMVEPEILEGTDQEVRCWVEEGVADLGICGEPGDNTAVPLVRDELLLVTHQNHPLALMESVPMRALSGMPFVMSGSGCEPMLERLLKKASVKIDVRLRVREMSALLAMVRSGMGVSIVPQLSLAANSKVGIISRSLSPTIYRQLYILRRSGASTFAIDSAFQAFQRLSKTPD